MTSLCSCHLLEGPLRAGKNPQQRSVLGIYPLSRSPCPILSSQCYIPQRKVIPHSRPEDYRLERSLCCLGNAHLVLSHWCPPSAKGQHEMMTLAHPRLREQQGLWGWGASLPPPSLGVSDSRVWVNPVELLMGPLKMWLEARPWDLHVPGLTCPLTSALNPLPG